MSKMSWALSPLVAALLPMRQSHGRTVRTALFGLGVVACGGGMQFDADFDPATDFSKYRTFFWAVDQRETGDPRLDNPVLDARIRSAVDQQLTATGLTKVEGRSGDLGVRYHAVLQDLVRTDTFDDAYAGVFRQETVSTPYTEGTLVLDLYDGATTELVWRGSAQAEVNQNNDPRRQSERINEAVRQMLEQYPGR